MRLATFADMVRSHRLAPQHPFVRLEDESPLIGAIRRACEGRSLPRPASSSSPPATADLYARPYGTPRIVECEAR